MAKIDNLFENSQGKLGNLVFYKVGGSVRVRTRAAHFNDKKSPAQLAQRQRLQVAAGFLKPFRDLIRITFASEAVGRSAMQAAQSYTMRNALAGEYPNIFVDISKALLSSGPLPLPMNARVEAKPDGLLIQWENGKEAAGKAANDTLVVIARFKDASDADYLFTGTQRSAGKYLWRLTKPLLEEAMPDVWIAFRNTGMTEMSCTMLVTS